MNAISKGVAIGMYDESKKDGVEASKGGSQPYVDLMGRRYGKLAPMWSSLAVHITDHFLHPLSHVGTGVNFYTLALTPKECKCSTAAVVLAGTAPSLM